MHAANMITLGPRPVHQLRQSVDRRTVRRLIEVTVAAAFDLPLDELSAKTRRTAPVAFARQISMYCAHVTFGWSLTEAGSVFGRDRTTAAHACRVVEDRRDDPDIDVLVQSVEGMLQAWLSGIEGCRSSEGEGTA